MNGLDQKIYKERLEKFKNLITKEFAPNKYEIIYEPDISVAVNRSTKGRERNPCIKFGMDEEFMTDSDSKIEEVFQQAIHLAKKILNDPPMKDQILQGQIHLTDDGAIFNKRMIQRRCKGP